MLLDTAIAFVIVLTGLSAALQAAVSGLKDVLKLRWAAYASFLEDYYRSDVGSLGNAKDVPDEKRPGFVRTVLGQFAAKGRPEIQSAPGRFRALGQKLETLGGAARAVRTELHELAEGLSAARTNDEKLGELRAFAEQVLPRLREQVEVVVSLHPSKLLSVYNEATGFFESLPSLEGQRKGFADLEELLRRYRPLADALDEADTTADVATAEAVATVEATLADVLRGLEDLDDRVSAFRARFEATFDDAVARVSSRYEQYMKRWCFAVAIVMCTVINADTFAILTSLQSSPGVVQELIAAQSTVPPRLDDERHVEAEQINRFASGAAGLLREGAKLDEGEAKRLSGELKLLIDGLDADRRAIEKRTQSSVRDVVDPVRAARTALEEAIDGLEKANKKSASSGDGAEGQVSEGDPLREEAVATRARVAAGAVTRAQFELHALSVSAEADRLIRSGLPLGWEGDFLGGMSLRKLGGILITAVLLTFGAPLWNDVLAALLGVRGLLGRRRGRSGEPSDART